MIGRVHPAVGQTTPCRPDGPGAPVPDGRQGAPVPDGRGSASHSGLGYVRVQRAGARPDHNAQVAGPWTAGMEVHDEFVPEDLFAEFLERMPQVCVEVVVEYEGSVLLALRENEPAKGEWFWPGSRLYKGEETEAAARRVAREELGIDVEPRELLGVYSHFWDRSAHGVSRHTVNVVYRVSPVDPDPDVTLDDQHADVRWVDESDPGLHEHVRQYLADL